MRVLHVAAGNLWGGVETYLETLAVLDHEGEGGDWRESFALAFDGRLARQLRECGATLDLLGPARLSRPWTVVRARSRLRALVSRERPDVAFLHGVWSHAVFGPTLAALGVPLVAYVHDVCRGHWLERLAARTRPKALVTPSASILEAARPFFRGVPSSVVYYALRLASPDWLDDSSKRSSARAICRAQLGTEDTAVVILIACRLERWKGQALLLDALAHLRDDSTWRLWIAGGAQRPHEQTYLQELKESAARLGIAERVQFLGQRDDVPRLLNAADVLCQPNTTPEPFGVVFVEALAAGKPVVTTGIEGAHEVVDASCGILVERDAGALASALGRLIADPRERAHLGAGGPARARLLCDPEARLQELVAVARSAIAPQSVSP